MKQHLRNAAKRPNDSFLMRSESRLRSKLHKRLTKQMNWLVNNIRNLTFLSENGVVRNSIDGDIEAFLNGMPEKGGIAEDIVIGAKSSMDKGGKTIMRELHLGNFGISWKVTNNDALKFLGGKLSHELSNYKGNIDSVTKQAISSILRDAAVSGQSYTKTAQQIIEQGKAGVFSKARGELIAVREIGLAYEEGKNIPIKDFQAKFPSHMVQKYWQTVNDNRVTAPHAQNEADGWILEQETFSGTGDSIAPGSDNPRCRCFTKYRIQE